MGSQAITIVPPGSPWSSSLSRRISFPLGKISRRRIRTWVVRDNSPQLKLGASQFDRTPNGVRPCWPCPGQQDIPGQSHLNFQAPLRIKNSDEHVKLTITEINRWVSVSLREHLLTCGAPRYLAEIMPLAVCFDDCGGVGCGSVAGNG